MKYNKNIVYALFVTGLFALSSCTKFLEEDVRSGKTLETYFKTEAQALAQVNSLYRRGAPTNYSSAGSAYIGPSASVNSMLTGYFTNSYEGQELVCLYARQLTRQQNVSIVSNSMNGIWESAYKSIDIANGGIKYIPSIAMNDDRRKVLLAEAKYFRAANYFYLVKMFGAVPLTLAPYENLENLYLPRTEASKIYEIIEADLQEAVANLPAKTFATNGHRITKYVAAMTLANVYLQQGKNNEAAATAQIVVNSSHNLTQNQDLAANSAYNQLRKTDDLGEVIYAQEYNGTITNSAWWPTYAFNASATSVFSTYSIFERVFGPTDQFLNVYAADDLRIKPNQFFHWQYTNPADTTKKWSSTVAGVWYFYDEDALLTTGRGTKDWNFYRYPEALLIAAEGIVSGTGAVTAEAVGYLALLKARTSTTGKTVADFTSELQALSKDKFIEEVWNERLREFPLEFKMWDDITRTKKFPVISTTTKGSVSWVNLIGAKNGFGATFKESDLLWPISIEEMQRNPSLTQNDGYK
ncbi:RagB/SusD family nutrient uptake outer membrane protein [Sphingobacterium sp. MYb382]|uniref:RagB/SusD family nutrient uptake outer membrane protein n=1 Tax=Sphingobacterium sp. MYb382 TaxID=2745278 RepID=UPI0030A76FB7